MLELRPFAGHVVVGDHAARVVAPPYDALSPETRAALAASDPDSYLGALPPGATGGVTAALEAALARCREHLAGLLAGGRFRRLERPSLLVLAIGAGARRGVAIVGDVAVGAYTDGRIRPHERTRDDRVAELVRYLEVVGVASSAVAVTQRPHPDVTAATAPVLATTPTVAFRDDDGIDIALWVVDDAAATAALTAAVDAAGTGYVADGHHRAAAAARFAQVHGHGHDVPGGRVLTAVLPSDHLAVLPFHRRIDGAVTADDPRAAEAVLERIRAAGFALAPLDAPAVPSTHGTLHVVVAGRWYAADGASLVADDPVEGLDVRLFERHLVPAVGADTPPAPVAAPLGLTVLDVPGAVGVALRPAAIDEVLAIADTGGTTPAKTTYVTPKLRSGLVVTPRSDAAPGT